MTDATKAAPDRVKLVVMLDYAVKLLRDSYDADNGLNMRTCTESYRSALEQVSAQLAADAEKIAALEKRLERAHRGTHFWKEQAELREVRLATFEQLATRALKLRKGPVPEADQARWWQEGSSILLELSETLAPDDGGGT